MLELGQWADGPWDLIETPSKTQDVKEHSAIYVASEMTHAHNCIIRALNSIYLQAPHVKHSRDVVDLLFFTKVLCDWIDFHHRLEEEHMFGAFEELSGRKGCMQSNVEQHHAFEDGLHQLRQYARTTEASDYDANSMLEIMDSFTPGLHTHLIDEIATLLELQSCDSAAVLAIFKKAEKVAGKMPITEILPLLMGLCDRTYEGGIHSWPPAPWFAPWVVYYLISWKHEGAWRFCPSDTWSMPRRLEFRDKRRTRRTLTGQR